MALDLLRIGVILLSAISITLFFIVLRSIYGSKDEPENKPILENYMPQYSQGYTQGIVEDIEFGDRIVTITFYPRDVNYRKLMKKKNVVLKPIKVHFLRSMIEVYGEGEFSSHRTLIKAYPPSVDLLPPKVQELNPSITSKVSDKKNKSNVEHILGIENRNLMNLARDMKGLEVVRDFESIRKEVRRDASPYPQDGNKNKED